MVRPTDFRATGCRSATPATADSATDASDAGRASIGCGLAAPGRRRAWLAGALFAAAGLAAGSLPAPAHAAEKWNLYVYNAVSTVSAVKGLTRICEEVEKATNGELSIRLHLGGSLPINTTTITPAVSDDVVQMGDDGYFLGNVPIGGVLRLPMLIQSLAEYEKAAAIMEPYLQRAFARKGAVVLGQYLYPYQVAYSTKKLGSLGDFKGQKIRVTSPEQGEFIKRLGGVPVTIGAPEVPSALERGVVDGVLTANAGGGVIWKDLLKSNYRLGINYFNSVIIVNKERFEKLPPDVRAKLQKVVSDNLPLITAAMAGEEDQLSTKFAEGGMTITPASAEDAQAAARLAAPFWDEWAKSKGPEVQEAAAKVRAALGR